MDNTTATNSTIIIQLVSWSEAHDHLQQLRREVFIREQGIPEEEEWDQDDERAIHFLAWDTTQNRPAGTVRLLPSGKITRMAVSKPYRRRGIGSQLLAEAMEQAHKIPVPSLYLDAQLTAVPFYRRFGFITIGSPFVDAGILHLRMVQQSTGNEP